jgi:hypothetical protein
MDEEEYDVSAKFRLVVGESFSAGKHFTNDLSSQRLPSSPHCRARRPNVVHENDGRTAYSRMFSEVDCLSLSRSVPHPVQGHWLRSPSWERGDAKAVDIPLNALTTVST